MAVSLLNTTGVPLWRACLGFGYIPVRHLISLFKDSQGHGDTLQAIEQWFLTSLLMAASSMQGVY
jgi:hypothetical protein